MNSSESFKIQKLLLLNHRFSNKKAKGILNEVFSNAFGSVKHEFLDGNNDDFGKGTLARYNDVLFRLNRIGSTHAFPFSSLNLYVKSYEFSSKRRLKADRIANEKKMYKIKFNGGCLDMVSVDAAYKELRKILREENKQHDILRAIRKEEQQEEAALRRDLGPDFSGSVHCNRRTNPADDLTFDISLSLTSVSKGAVTKLVPALKNINTSKGK
jgi:hypothetical protein